MFFIVICDFLMFGMLLWFVFAGLRDVPLYVRQPACSIHRDVFTSLEYILAGMFFFFFYGIF